MSQINKTNKNNAKQAQDNNKDRKKPTPVRSLKKAPADSGARKGNETNARMRSGGGIINQLVPYMIGVAALFIALCFILIDGFGLERPMGAVGSGLRGVLLGLFGWSAFLIPAVMAAFALFYHKCLSEGTLLSKLIFGFVCVWLTSTLIQTFYIHAGGERTLNVVTHYKDGLAINGGGAVGGFTGDLFYSWFGFAGSLIIAFALLFVFLMFFFGLTPKVIWVYIRYNLKLMREKRASKVFDEPVHLNRAKTVPDKPSISVPPETAQTVPDNAAAGERAGGNFDPDVDITEYKTDNSIDPANNPPSKAEINAAVSEAIDPKVFDEVLAKSKAEKSEMITDSDGVDDVMLKPVGGGEKKLAALSEKEYDLGEIFTYEGKMSAEAAASGKQNAAATDAAVDEKDADGSDEAEIELAVSKRRIVERTVRPSPVKTPDAAKETPPVPAPEQVSAPIVPVYIFPPIELLKLEKAPQDTGVNDELQNNARKLVETLMSFNVRTKIVHVSRGPTITRYELQPEPGTRVRSISNLVDDIALNLATTGVRIEAPIPGKSAVGIEVPNKNVATVYVRELIENEQFKQSSSKLTACLGVDVAGAPIYCDISKMPHLLIAGATGMGKSVCINSIIISLLYKSTPDEVKLILVDPKKVELNIYNGIPQLLVPVVFDPKKAAGALHWAVTEMDRRFELIEEEGVRDLKHYNEAVAGDPEKEKVPQIVIIIDELADLMMTAPDDVEQSICRLAQKARAAGMHLIIGTQRPSVDVITGLIKANIPSRIAFTVASQIDSRTIIDMAGAEKLIGRGDMLYAPVGASKPIRVQGAFVSENEIESVTKFIKEHVGVSEYSDEIADAIEKEAAMCTNKKRGSASEGDGEGEDEEDDPMLRPAIELAIECKKISTSLIQRRLSLGYGRAAKLIDCMEKRGYVSPPDGQKPRDVLITKQEYMEMVLNSDGQQ